MSCCQGIKTELAELMLPLFLMYNHRRRALAVWLLLTKESGIKEHLSNEGIIIISLMIPGSAL